MQAASIRPDTVVYAAVIDLLWCCGIVGAQQRAQQLFQSACRQSVRGMEALQAAAQDDADTLEVTLLTQLWIQLSVVRAFMLCVYMCLPSIVALCQV